MQPAALSAARDKKGTWTAVCKMPFRRSSRSSGMVRYHAQIHAQKVRNCQFGFTNCAVERKTVTFFFLFGNLFGKSWHIWLLGKRVPLWIRIFNFAPYALRLHFLRLSGDLWALHIQVCNNNNNNDKNKNTRKGAVHILRRHFGGRGGFANDYQCLRGGWGGLINVYVVFSNTIVKRLARPQYDLFTHCRPTFALINKKQC